MDKKWWIGMFLFTGLLIAGFTPYNASPESSYYSPYKSRFESPYESSYESSYEPGLRERKIQQTIYRQLVCFHDYVKDTLLAEVSNNEPDPQKIRSAFLQSRLLFKEFEWAIEYFAADLSKRLNGPPVQEIENADLLDSSLAYPMDPMGLQVIEEYIYPAWERAGKEGLIREIGHLINNTDYLISYFSELQLARWRILDAAKLEVFRIIALGITGFDSALSLNSMEECAASLKSLRDILSPYISRRMRSSLPKDLDAAIAYLHQHTDFNSFDRATFIIRFANKISTGIAQLEQDLPGPGIKYNRMLNQEAKTLFDHDAFNVNAFTPGPEYHLTDDKIALGEKLFFDASLSGTGTRSCASCHSPALAFTDGLTKPVDIHNPANQLGRNVPTLINAALQSNYFYDMRALTLEEQVWDVLTNKQEMDGSIDKIIKYLSSDRGYRDLFNKAFPEDAFPATAPAAKTYTDDYFPVKAVNGISADKLTNALASYIRSLTRLNSRFDEYMRGKEDALSKDELKGFNLFMGKAKCATCHFVPLFNGITPPKYIVSETEVLGVPVSAIDSTLDPDPGYYDIIGVNSYKHAFKIPSVRNISKTAPYMHNGAYQTLEQVMEFYNTGGAAGLGINLPNQTLSRENLNLTEKEKTAIIAFMKSLES